MSGARPSEAWFPADRLQTERPEAFAAWRPYRADRGDCLGKGVLLVRVAQQSGEAA